MKHISVYINILTTVKDSFYATKEERKKNQRREYEKQMAERAHLQGWCLHPVMCQLYI